MMPDPYALEAGSSLVVGLAMLALVLGGIAVELIEKAVKWKRK